MALLPNGNFITYTFNIGPGWTTVVPASTDPIIIGIDLGEPLKQKKVKQGNAEGYECLECKDFYPMAELNIPEGSSNCHSFKCYSCRHGLRVIFQKKEKQNE